MDVPRAASSSRITMIPNGDSRKADSALAGCWPPPVPPPAAPVSTVGDGLGVSVGGGVGTGVALGTGVGSRLGDAEGWGVGPAATTASHRPATASTGRTFLMVRATVQRSNGRPGYGPGRGGVGELPAGLQHGRQAPAQDAHLP